MQHSQLKTSHRRRPGRNLTRRLSRAALAAACALLVVLGGVAVWRVAAVNFFVISTVAGSGGTGNEVVTFNGARGVAFDPNNSAIIYVADAGNHVVRRVDTTTTPPTVTVVAGQFTVAATNPLDSGGIGDGGLAASAHLSSPSDIVFDSSGNYYIADTGTNRIRKVNTQGTSATADDTISTVVGTGAAGSLNGDVSIATLFNPRGLGIDAANNLYIADTGNHLIRKLVGSTVSTVAGNNVFGAVFADGVPATDSTLNGPLDVAVTGDNRIYIADTANHRVRIVGTDGIINTVAGSGTGIFSGDGPDLGTNLSLSSPSSLTANDNNGVYVADTGNHRLRFISSAGQMNTVAGRLTAHGTVARGYDGDGTASDHSLDSPSGVGFFIQGANTGRVALMDVGNNRLRVIQVFTGLMTSATSDGSSGSAGDNGPATAAKLNAPLGVAVDAAGSIYVADTANHVVRKITGTTITTVAGTVGVPGSAGEGVTAATAPLNKPTGVAVDANGVLYISDTGNNVVRKVDGGVITTAVASAPNPPTDFNPTPPQLPLNTPQGLALDSGGTLFIADTGNHRIVRLAAAFPVATVAGRGEQGTSGDNGSPTEARLNFPYGVAADPTSGNIYIADTNNHRVRFVNFSTSKITTVIAATGVPRADFVGDGGPATSARLNTPVAVAVDSGGSFYVTDRGNNRIRRVVNGTINTVVGSGAVGFSGDGGSATLAALGYPNGIALGTAGLFIADTGNNRIRRAVPPSNNAPTLTNPGNQTVSEGATVGFTLAATDSDSGQTISYSMSGAPVGATLDANTGAFSYSPDFSVIPNTVGASQTFTIIFTATDSAVPSASDSETISLTVNNVNRQPTASAGTVTSPVEATSAAGASVPLNGTTSDPDGDTLTFDWKDGATTVATANPASPTLAIGAHSLTLTVGDGKGGTATSAPVAVTVQDTTPPVFAGVPSNVTQTISSGTSATVNFTTPTASDAVDGARAVTTTRSDGQTGNVFPVGTTTVTFMASDTRGNAASAGFTVTISNSGQPPAQDTTYNINAFAGSGGYGAASSAGAATAAAFKQPSGVAVNAAGDVYIADAESRVIRRITGGTVFPFAGTGAKGATGDGGQATAATFNNPTGLAVDSAGNVYIADTNNHRVRKVTGTTISTIAGTGVAGFFGDGGQATTAQLSFPTAVAVDAAGNVYIADTGNNRVRKITGTTISTVAGNGAAGFSGDGGSPTAASLNYPSGLAVTSDGLTLYIADTGNNRVRRVVSAAISTYAGTGSAGFGGDSGVATLAALNGPTGLAFDPNGNLLIADTDNERIRRVKLSDSVIVTVAGTGAIGSTGDGGAATSATLDTPSALAVHAATGNVYFADAGNLRARVLGPAAANNAAPVIAAIPASTVNVGQTTNVALSATDADGNSVTFTLAPGAPAFLSIINANPPARTATLFISPACANLGVHSVQVQANDGTTTVTSPSFSVTVTDSLAACGPVNNQPPVAAFNSLASPVEATGPSGFTVSLNGLASSDPNNDPLTFQWTDNGSLFSTSATTARTLTLGTHTITLTVSDGQGGINSTSKTVLVRDTTAPTISVSPNAVSFTQAQTVVLPTPTVSDTVDTSVTVTNNAPASYPLGNTVVTFTATDDAGNSATASVTVTITSGGGGGGGGGSTPSLTSITPTSGRRNQTVQMTISGSGFDQGAEVTIFGGGLTLSNVSISSTQITLSVRISSTATLSRRTVTVTNPNTQSATLSQAFQVTQ